jgi:hypothetical protein
MIGVKIGDYKELVNKDIDMVKMHHNCPRLDRSGFFPGKFFCVEYVRFWKVLILFSKYIYIIGNYDMSQFCDFHSFHADAYSKVPELEKVYEKLFDNQTVQSIKNYDKEFIAIRDNKTPA